MCPQRCKESCGLFPLSAPDLFPDCHEPCRGSIGTGKHCRRNALCHRPSPTVWLSPLCIYLASEKTQGFSFEAGSMRSDTRYSVPLCLLLLFSMGSRAAYRHNQPAGGKYPVCFPLSALCHTVPVPYLRCGNLRIFQIPGFPEAAFYPMRAFDGVYHRKLPLLLLQ